MPLKRDTESADAKAGAAAQPAVRLQTPDLLGQVIDELASTDRGLPWTLAQLLLRPGWAIRRYVEHRDPRLTRPFRLALACLALAALVLHLFGSLDAFGAGFADGVASGADGAGRASAMQAAGALVFGRFDLMLVLAWVPAAAFSLQRVYPQLGLNFAEACVFGLYTLAITVLLFTPLSLLPWSGPAWLAVAVALPLWSLAHAAFGFARPDGHGPLRALGFALLAQLTAVLVLVALLLVATAAFSMFGG